MSATVRTGQSISAIASVDCESGKVTLGGPKVLKASRQLRQIVITEGLLSQLREPATCANRLSWRLSSRSVAH